MKRAAGLLVLLCLAGPAAAQQRELEPPSLECEAQTTIRSLAECLVASNPEAPSLAAGAADVDALQLLGARRLAGAIELVTSGRHAAAEAYLRDALTAAVAWQSLSDEIYLRRYLAYVLREQQQALAALAEVELAVLRLDASQRGDELPQLQHNLVVDLVSRRLQSGYALNRNLALLEQVAATAVSGEQQLRFNAALGASQELMGQWAQAQGTYREQMVLALAEDDFDQYAAAAWNDIDLGLRRWLEQAQSFDREAQRVLLLERSQALYQQLQQHHRDSSTRQRLWLRLLHTLGMLQGDQQYLEQCSAQAGMADLDGLRVNCMIDQAWLAAKAGNLARARQLRSAALQDVTRAQSLWAASRLTQSRIHVAWAIDEPRAALDETIAALTAAQLYRLAQDAGVERARLFAAWVDAHRLAAGYVMTQALGAPADQQQWWLQQALQIQEMMRARQLLDEVLQQRDRLGLIDASLIGQRAQAIADEISRLQQSGQDRADWPLAALRQLHQPLTPSSPAALALPDKLMPQLTLQALQQRLQADEAMLIYQVARSVDAQGDAAGGSWVMAVGSDWVRLLSLQAEGGAAGAAQLAWLETSGYLDPAPLQALTADWWLPIFNELPAQVRHLTIVPDAVLIRLPWMLMAARTRPPSGELPSLSLAPSASLWMEWRQMAAQPGQALVLADPAIADAAREQLATAAPPLPGSRREAARLARLFAGVTRHQGAEASVQSLRQTLTPAHRLVHFATHAVINSTDSAKSAILLAADEEHQGVFDMAAISQQDWSGAAIVLAACEGAGGRMVDGEGLLSLARSFLGAGAKVVIANPWPLDDAHASAYFSRFYWHLAAGHTLADSMRLTQDEMIAAGYPATAWGGYQAIGDAAFRPLAKARSGSGRWLMLLLTAALVYLLVYGLRRWRG
ncbi:MAG: hypothetical protein Tsb002_05960 [Wenzhouxiangellaceae bacterium]